MRGSTSGCAGLRSLVFPILGFLCSLQSPANQPQGVRSWTTYPAEVTFQHMTVAQGLLQSTVFCTLQDSRGLMWFGTENGLNLYDGNRFTVFHHKEGREDCIGSDWVTCLLEDPRGYLWVGTIGGGLSYINLHTMTIHSTFRDPAPVPNQDVSCLALDREGNLWIGTQAGLFMLPAAGMPPASMHFIAFPTDAKDPHAFPDAWVSSMLVDHRGILWAGAGSLGLCQVRKEPETGLYIFECFRGATAPPNHPAPSNLFALAEDGFGVIWMGTYDGLYSFFPEQKVFHRYSPVPGDDRSLSAPFVLKIHSDRQKRIWVGTEGGGLDRMLPRNHAEEPPRFEAYKHQPMNLKSLGGNGIWSIYEDRTGVLWVGAYQSGLSKLFLGPESTRENPVVQYSNKPLDLDSLSGDLVNAIIEDAEGNLWIGTDGTGLNRVIPPKSSSGHLKFERFRADKSRPGALQDDVITALYLDREHRIWAGTYTGGLVRIDFPSGSSSGLPRFVHYRNKPGDSSTLSNNFVTHIYEDSKHRFWILTVNGGLNRFDPVTGKFKSYMKNQNIGLSTNTLYSIAEDRYGTLWIGSHPGVNRFNPETGKAKAYLPDNKPESLSHPIAFAVHIDSRGTLWIGTNGGGLNKVDVPPWDGAEPRFIHYGIEDGIPDNVIRAISEDAKGQLWLSTSRTLCRFDPAEGKGHPFPWRPELLNNEYIRNSCQVFRSGELAFGGVRGFCIFDPKNISLDSQPPAVAITDLKLSGKSVPVGARISGQVLLERSVQETKEIILTHREYEFSIEFTALNFASPDMNQYAYMMEGLDRDWNHCGNRSFATYTTLPPGDYVFRIKASNCDGVWNENGASLRIHVVPPWWMTWWFRGLVAFTLVGVVYVIIQARIKAFRRRNLMLKQMVANRTSELAEANDALRDLSLTDPLTGLRNRRFLYACMPEDVAQIQRIQRDVANNDERMKLNIDVLILLVDIDHFKFVNDRHGHHAGDMVLQKISTILQGAVRGSDTVVRWGGEEFLIIARNSARIDATVLPERIRASVASFAFDIGEANPLHLTCSVGFSVFPFLPNEMNIFTWEEIIAVADDCLYTAKRGGRNAWVGVVPEVFECAENAKEHLPKTVCDLMKAQLFKPLTSLDGPLHWEDRILEDSGSQPPSTSLDH